jgi:hypothetical protein
LDLKQLLKRGALITAANWQVVAIQFVAETTFQVLLAVPVVGAAVLVAVLLGADLAELLQGSLREMFTTIASALLSEPVALVCFMTAFSLVLFGGSVLMFAVKGGTIDVLVASSDSTGPIEQDPITYQALRAASQFSLQRFTHGCSRLFRRYLALGVALTVVYALSGGAYLAFVIYGYRSAADRTLLIGWTFIAALAAGALAMWLTVVNLVYLLVQLAMAMEDLPLRRAWRAVVSFARAEFRDLAGVFLVVVVLVIGATLASALAWSGVGLIAFVPLIGLAVFPVQIMALLVRGLLFEYLGQTALSAYITLYLRYLGARQTSTERQRLRSTLGVTEAWGQASGTGRR